MPYRSGFEFRNGGLGPYVGAIPFAAVGSAGIGTAVMIVLLSITEISWSFPSSVNEIMVMALGAVMGIGFMVTAATFVTGFYLALFGLPVAILMGQHLHRRWALGVALLDAAASAVFAVTGNQIGALDGDGPSPVIFAIVLSYALPAGFLYRRNVIQFRELAALTASP